MFPRAAGGWGRWAAGVVFEDWECLRDRVSSGVPGGRRIVAAVDAIAQACPPGPLSSQDLVHGNFNLASTLAAAGRLWVVDVEALGAGPLAYDLAETLLVAAGHGHLTESAAARLRTYAAGLDRREFAICAGSVGLTMAQSFVRHGRAGDAASGPGNSADHGAGPRPGRGMTTDPGRRGPSINELQLVARTIWLWGLMRRRSRTPAR